MYKNMYVYSYFIIIDVIGIEPISIPFWAPLSGSGGCKQFTSHCPFMRLMLLIRWKALCNECLGPRNEWQSAFAFDWSNFSHANCTGSLGDVHESDPTCNMHSEISGCLAQLAACCCRWGQVLWISRVEKRLRAMKVNMVENPLCSVAASGWRLGLQ